MKVKHITLTAFAALTLAMATSAGAVTAPVGGLEVSEPGSTVDGLTIAERAVEWGLWLLDMPVFEIPGSDVPYTPGPLEDQGTSFLYGGAPVLDVRIRQGQDLLLPAQPSVYMTYNASETLEVLQEQAAEDAEGFASDNDLSVTVNGVDFETASGRDVYDYREIYPSNPADPIVGLSDPENSWVLDYLGAADYDSEFGKIIVADGYWMLFENMPLGVHEIVATAISRETGEELFRVTHNITVAPIPLPAALPLLLTGLAGLGGAAARRRRSA